MIFLITYDLKGPSTAYDPLYEYLKGQGGWAHYLASTWFIDTEKTPDDIVNDLKPLLQAQDRVFVVRIERPYQGLLPTKAWDWIHKHQKKTGIT